MFGASWLNSIACFTIAWLSRKSRGSVCIESRPLRPRCASKIGLSRAAARMEISRTTCQAISSSVAVGISLTSSCMRPFQKLISLFSTPTTITGLHVAPTAPCSIEYVNSSMEAESFHKQVGVVCVILCRGLL